MRSLLATTDERELSLIVLCLVKLSALSFLRLYTECLCLSELIYIEDNVILSVSLT